MWTYVDVAFDGNRAHVSTPLGNFTVSRNDVHQITQPGAHEHICTLRGELPKEDGSNVLCIFWRPGYM